tara:strand:- start:254 stop:529 length:276 start_codon:yes stop_codon:yes gene_type:complete
MNRKRVRKQIREALTATDKKDIGVMIRKEIKKEITPKELEKVVVDLVKKELKGKPMEDKVVEISRNVLIQLYKQFWVKRNLWAPHLKNQKS